MRYEDVKKHNPKLYMAHKYNSKLCSLKRELEVWEEKNNDTYTKGSYDIKINKIKAEIKDIETKKGELTMVEFAKGVNIKSVSTRYGEILKVGINVEEFCTNHINDRGYINFDILRAKETNKPYAQLDTYNKQVEHNSEIEEVAF